MPLPKKSRVESLADPLAPAVEDKRNAGSAEDLRQTLVRREDARRKRSERPVSRREHFGAVYDPSLKSTVVAHAGASGQRTATGRTPGGLFLSSSNARNAPASTEGPHTVTASFDALATLLGIGDEQGAPAEIELRRGKWSERVAPHLPLSSIPIDPLSAVPDVEPWDEFFLRAPSYSCGWDDSKLDDLEHHIPLLPGPNTSPKDAVIPLVKTKDELRRERHLRRVEAAKQREEDRRSGALPKEEQRLTLKHLASASILSQGVSAPTEVAYLIRQQVEQRVIEHYERNELRSRQAADHQKQHHFEVLERRASERPRVAVYRVTHITDEYLLTKAKIHAKDHFLRGMVLWVQQQWALLVLIGGQRPLRVIDGLLSRQQWPQGCAVDLIWSSPITPVIFEQRYFLVRPLQEDSSKTTERVRLVRFKTAADALEALRSERLGHAWDASVKAPEVGDVALGPTTAS